MFKLNYKYEVVGILYNRYIKRIDATNYASLYIALRICSPLTCLMCR